MCVCVCVCYYSYMFYTIVIPAALNQLNNTLLVIISN